MTRFQRLPGLIAERLVVGGVLPLILLLIWIVADSHGALRSPTAATPGEVTQVLWVEHTPLVAHAWASFERLVIGVTIGAILGLVTGTLFARARFLDRIASPSLQLLAPVPIIVWIPFAVMLFGIGSGFKVALVAMSTYFITHFQTFQAIRAVPNDFLELAKVYGKGRWRVFTEILLPSALPSVLVALRTSLSFGWVVLCVAEFSQAVAGGEGLGYYVMYHYNLIQPAQAIAGVLILAIIAFAIDAAVALVHKLLTDWTDVDRPEQRRPLWSKHQGVYASARIGRVAHLLCVLPNHIVPAAIRATS